MGHGVSIAARVGPAVHAVEHVAARGFQLVGELLDLSTARVDLGHRSPDESDESLKESHGRSVQRREGGRCKPGFVVARPRYRAPGSAERSVYPAVGSSTSRKPSPSRLKPSTASVMVTPGTKAMSPWTDR